MTIVIARTPDHIDVDALPDGWHLWRDLGEEMSPPGQPLREPSGESWGVHRLAPIVRAVDPASIPDGWVVVADSDHYWDDDPVQMDALRAHRVDPVAVRAPVEMDREAAMAADSMGDLWRVWRPRLAGPGAVADHKRMP